MTAGGSREPRAASTPVQSVGRALDILEVIQSAGGALSITEIAAETTLSVATIHRLARTLLDRGYLRQLPDRRYCLGTRLVTLGETANSLIGQRTRPLLLRLAGALGETVNLAVLSGSAAEYVGQATGSHSMRMFTELGRRVPLHCTGVGKALLSMLPDDHAARLLRHTGLPSRTPGTITDLSAMLEHLKAVRANGYVLDEGEMEIGVRCVAVALHMHPLMALSVSGPSERMTDAVIEATVVRLRAAGTQIVDLLGNG